MHASYRNGFEKIAAPARVTPSRLGMFTGGNIALHSVLPAIGGAAAGTAAGGEDHRVLGGVLGAVGGGAAGTGLLAYRNRGAYRNLVAGGKDILKTRSDIKTMDNALHETQGKAHEAEMRLQEIRKNNRDKILAAVDNRTGDMTGDVDNVVNTVRSVIPEAVSAGMDKAMYETKLKRLWGAKQDAVKKNTADTQHWKQRRQQLS